jgi:hypothetical protein
MSKNIKERRRPIAKVVSDTVLVAELPYCDYCKANGIRNRADYDGKTKSDSWYNMCHFHFKKYGIGLGTGKGQRLVITQDNSWPEGHGN